MTPIAAESLAVRISQTWPKSPPVDVWAEDLSDLDEGAAGTAFVRLRRESEHAPSIAKFRAVALGMQTAEPGQVLETCSACDGTGYVEAPNHDPGWNDREGNPIVYSAVRKCSCAS